MFPFVCLATWLDDKGDIDTQLVMRSRILIPLLHPSYPAFYGLFVLNLSFNCGVIVQAIFDRSFLL